MFQILSGVLAIHECNLVHRDMKLDNVLVQIPKEGEYLLKITDFGFSRSLDTSLAQTFCGTPIHMVLLLLLLFMHLLGS
jgi:serine/threonine protein kinase